MSTLVVTGAFATHTTKLYNYYVCPNNWNIANVEHIAVNYRNELKYLGKVTEGPLNWSFFRGNGELNDRFIFPPNLNPKLQNDLRQFACKLNEGNHYLFLLEPIIGGCVHENLRYMGNGAFTRGHRFFPTIGDMMVAHQGVLKIIEPEKDSDAPSAEIEIIDVEEQNTDN